MNIFRCLCLAAVVTLGLSGLAQAKPAPRNGVQKELYTNGRLKLYTKFRNGKIVRKKAFYENGKVLLDEVYKLGKPSVIRTYYEDGKRKSVWTRKTQVTKIYSPNGKLKTVVTSGENRKQKFPASFIFSN